VFRGLTGINLDTKGRMVMPTRYREALARDGSTVILTIDTEATCLLLYPVKEWELIEKKIEALPSFNQATRRIQRLLIGHATEVELDGNGRILLPPLLREYAGLDKRVMLVGQGKKFELWDETQWQQGRAQWLTEAAGKLSELPTGLESISL
jgi:MraZ protein